METHYVSASLHDGTGDPINICEHKHRTSYAAGDCIAKRWKLRFVEYQPAGLRIFVWNGSDYIQYKGEPK